MVCTFEGGDCFSAPCCCRILAGYSGIHADLSHTLQHPAKPRTHCKLQHRGASSQQRFRHAQAADTGKLLDVPPLGSRQTSAATMFLHPVAALLKAGVDHLSQHPLSNTLPPPALLFVVCSYGWRRASVASTGTPASWCCLTTCSTLHVRSVNSLLSPEQPAAQCPTTIVGACRD